MLEAIQVNYSLSYWHTAYTACHGVNPPELKLALLVFKTGGEYFTLVASDPTSAVTVVTIKAGDGVHRAWKLFESEVDLHLFLTPKMNDYEAATSPNEIVTFIHQTGNSETTAVHLSHLKVQKSCVGSA